MSTPPSPPAATPPAPTPEPPAAEPRRLYRSRNDRVLGGVCGGLAEYFGIDPIIVRLAAVGLILAGGAGILLYIAALLLVPEEGGEPAAVRSTRGRVATIAGVVILVLAIAALLPGGFGWGGDVVWPVVVLGLIGLGVWRLASGQGAAGSGRDVARRIGLGLLLLALVLAVALASFWAAAVGGVGVVAGIVIAAGLALVAAGVTGNPRARWLIAPALALALPAAVVSAAGIHADGGVGDRAYHPLTADQVRGSYELGMGRLIVDLRGARLPAGDTPVKVRVGVGDAVLVVPDDVCVATRGRIGAGAYTPFGSPQGGLDVDVDDQPRAPARTPRLIVNADIGVGALEIRRTPPPDAADHRFGPGRGFGSSAGADPTGRGNAACLGGRA